MTGRSKRTALVTGASEGIGFAIAAALAHTGHRVVLAARRPDGLEAALRRLIAAGVDADNLLSVEIDIGNTSSIDAALATVAPWAPGLDILVNNAAIQFEQEKIEDITEKQLDDVFRTNIYSQYV